MEFFCGANIRFSELAEGGEYWGKCRFSGRVEVIIFGYSQNVYKQIGEAMSTTVQNIPKSLIYAPKIVVEIDTKADLDEVEDTFGYYHKKTKALLAFGIEKVIWIHTDLKSVLIAEKGKSWQIIDWDEDFVLLGDMKINILGILRFLQKG
ncbi:MAG: hypothetical protein KDD10_26585 [Phaeodactylibacter sp.]|nr:hypothetical protein [Phaeodactylibacter sp.]MCB9292876.1 hypothetical protein [Lewinellaceae bacterium]